MTERLNGTDVSLCIYVFIFLSITGYYKMLNIVPCAICNLFYFSISYIVVCICWFAYFLSMPHFLQYLCSVQNWNYDFRK